MKKIPVLLLILTGIIILGGCPPDPEIAVIDEITAPDFYIEDGIAWYCFPGTTPLIQANGKYEVLVDVSALDARLGGCHFQGQLYYSDSVIEENDDDVIKRTPGGTKYLLASTRNAQPQNIATNAPIPTTSLPEKYRFFLEVGNFVSMGSQYLVNEADADDVLEKNGETVDYTPAPAGTPVGKTQWLKIIVKTPNWYRIGVTWNNQIKNPQNKRDEHDDPAILDYYKTGHKWGVNAAVSIREQPDFDSYAEGAAVELSERVSASDGQGKGFIRGEEFQKLKNAPPDSVLRVQCSANVTAAATGGSQGARPNWGIGGFGSETEQARTQEVSVQIVVPTFWNGEHILGPSQDQGGVKEFYVDIYIDAILALSRPDETFLNMNNTGNQLSMRIRSPSP